MVLVCDLKIYHLLCKDLFCNRRNVYLLCCRPVQLEQLSALLYTTSFLQVCSGWLILEKN